MWKIYDVTNGLGHTFCNDIATARRVLSCIQKEIEKCQPHVTVTLRGDSFIYGCEEWDAFYVYEIKEVEVWNRVPDNLARYDYV